MDTYGDDIRKMQPLIRPLYSRLDEGFAEALDHHESHGDDRQTDPWFFLHQVRLRACRGLMDGGFQAVNESGNRTLLPMSSILLYHDDLAIRVMHAQPHAGDQTYPSEIPSPGASRLRQDFWSQRSTIPELQTENLVLLWLDDGARILRRMTLVRPLSGTNRRSDLRLDWTGDLLPEMASRKQEDLTILQPQNEHLRLYRAA